MMKATTLTFTPLNRAGFLMALKLKLSHKGIILVSVPLAFELIFVVMLAWMLENAQKEAQEEAQSRAVLYEANNLNKNLFDSASLMVAWNFTKSQMFRRKFEEAVIQLSSGIEKLNELTAGNDRQHAHAQKLKVLGAEVLGLMNAHADRIRLAGEGAVYSPSFSDFRKELAKGFEPFMQELQLLLKEEKKMQELVPQAEESRRMELRMYLFAGVVFNILVAVLLAHFFSTGIARRLAVLTENSERLAKGLPLKEPIGGVDEVAQLDRVFHKMADALERAEKRKKEFVAMISHDLRTPLNAIQGTLELLSHGIYGNLNEKGKIRVHDAERDSDRLISLINELLDIERLEAGKLDLEIEDTEVDPLVNRAINSVTVLADIKNVKLKSTPSNLKASVDPERFIQVLINLLGNAVKFSPEDGNVLVEIVGTSGWVEVRIKDEGPGIPADLKERIFDRFQQVDDDKHEKKGGSGLGLAICKALVEAHKGRIGVDSTDGKGSTFWFTVPRVMDAG